MALKGDLASVDLAQVFQMLALNQKVGLLSIQSPDVWRALYFDSRGVTLYYNEHLLVDRVIQRLVRTGRLFDEAVTAAREHAVNMGMTIVDSLLAGGYVEEVELEDLYRTELEEDIYDLFFWTDARFEFYEGATSFEGREGCISDRLFFSTDSLIMEAARRIDEWAYIREQVSGPQEVFVRLEGAEPAAASDGDRDVYELVDGRRTVATIIEQSALPSFQVYKTLATMLDAGAIAHIAPEELEYEAETCLEEGRVSDAINLFERAVELQVGLPLVHSQLARAYEQAEEYELAVLNLRTLANYHVEDGDLAAASENLCHALRLIPTDLDARARLVELTVTGDVKIDGFDPIASGKELVDLYLEMGEVDRVREILERLLRENPQDIELKKILVNVHTKTGDTRRVVELYESLAQDLVGRGQTIEAISYLQKILRLDRSRTDINERIRSLYRMDERQRSRRRSMIVLALLFVTVAAAGVGYLVYDDYARRAFDGIETEGLIEAGEFERAETIYSEFAQTYPLSRAAADAQAEAKRIAALRWTADAKAERERAARQRELGKVRSRYKLAFQRYEEQLTSGHPEQALRTLESVLAAVRDEAGEDADLRWAQSKGVDLQESHRQLKALLGGAVAKEREARQALSSGEWKLARAKILELVQEFGITKTARAARVPVFVATRPAGAQVIIGGEPVTHAGDGETPVVTPAIIQLPHGGVEDAATSSVTLRLPGFEDRLVDIDPLRRESVSEVLTVQPESVLRFSTEVVTGLGAEAGTIAAGLKDGQFGVARGGRVIYEGQLDDLASVAFAPTIVGQRVYFITNLNAIGSHRISGGAAPGWPIQLEFEAMHGLTVADGRIVVADLEGRLFCFEAGSGRKLWSRPLDGRAGGRAVLANRRVYLGTESGIVAMLDAVDGEVLRSIPVGIGVATRVEPLALKVVFGGTDGFLRAFGDDGKELWRRNLNRSLSDADFVVHGEEILAFAGERELLRIRADDGEILARSELAGRSQPTIHVVGDRVAVVCRVGEGKATEDVLEVRAIEALSPLWEYRDGGVFRGSVVISEGKIFVPGSTGEVVSFR